MKAQRFFTLAEANAMLPQLESLMKNVLEQKACCDKMHDHLFMEEILSEAEKQAGAPAPKADQEAQSVDNHIHRLGEEMQKFKSLGCVLRSLDSGLVDFPAVENDKVIFYVWRKGEKTIQFYRPSGAPATERIPLK